jgi:hypothetical protein
VRKSTAADSIGYVYDGEDLVLELDRSSATNPRRWEPRMKSGTPAGESHCE